MVVVPIFVFLLAISPGLEESKKQQDISSYLPESGDIEEWQPVGSPEKFEGEDLYSLINGGAVVYYEYGFRQVITQEYVNENGRFINLEIFEMTNPASAYGIYTFRTGDNGKEIPVGAGALLEDHYLNFWKGNYLVTLTAFDSKKETLDGLVTVAEAVDTRIEGQGQRPLLPDFLPKENLRIRSVKYLKGNVALASNYAFDSEDIFGLKEGVTGDYGDFEIFIFKYNDENESLRWFRNARDHLKNGSGFDGFSDRGDSFSVMDEEGRRIHVKPYQNHILIYLGPEETGSGRIFKKLEERME